MKLGFLTACMPERPLSEVAHFASAHGYGMLEVACWPRTSERDYNASHIDVATLDRAGADEIGRMFELSGLAISALAYYENNLAADPNERAVVNGHVRKTIDAAALLGVALVGTFVGHDLSKTADENMREAAEVFGELTAYAGQKGVRLMIENCPMVGWQRPWIPGNLFYAPAQWDSLFEQVPELASTSTRRTCTGSASTPTPSRATTARTFSMRTLRTPRSCAADAPMPLARPSWTTAGGAIACPASANSTGRASSVPCRRADTTMCSAPSTRTPCGRARRPKLTAVSSSASASWPRCCIELLVCQTEPTAREVRRDCGVRSAFILPATSWSSSDATS